MSGYPTVLDTATAEQVSHDPYAHLVTSEALPSGTYKSLCASFPSLEGINPKRAGASNKRLNLLSSWGPAELVNAPAPPPWRAFMDAHTDPSFSQTVFDLFPDVTDGGERGRRLISVDRFGPGLARRLDLPEQVPESEIIVRITLAANTPVLEATSVRGAHVDSPRMAFVGLYYLRHPDDDSVGGDLAIHRVKPGHEVEGWVQAADPDDVEMVDEIPYAANTLVMMLNTHDALHGVSVRQPTKHVRRFVVISGWFPGVDQADTSANSLARK